MTFPGERVDPSRGQRKMTIDSTCVLPAPTLANGPVEVRKHQDVEEFGAGCVGEGVETFL